MGEFDYIVVGAGTAGCVLAERLSADPGSKVLLIEAGGREINPLYRLPLLAGRLYRWRSNNWWYNSVPQPDLDNREIFLPRGKMVGGSFIFNGMVYIRGHASDFDSWAAMGNEGWSYRDALPLFKRSENYDRADNSYHGSGGKLPISRASESNPLTRSFLKACGEAGHALNDDINGENQDGFGLFDHWVKGGRRWSSAHAYLAPARKRPNLRVVTNALATRILLEDGRARGIEIRRGGRTESFGCRREVVLSAGAFNSPQLMLLSGIGPAEELKRIGVEPKIEIPGVGKNLRDHIVTGIGYKSLKPVSIVGSLRLDRLTLEMMRGVMLRTGPVARSVLEAGGFFRTKPGLPAPDVCVVFTPIFGPAARIWMPWSQSSDDHSFGATVMPIRPKSVGELRLKSPNPSDAPIIDPRYYSHPDDFAVTATALSELRRIFRQPALDQYRGAEISPGREVNSNEGWINHVKSTGSSGHHAVGTLKMGNDPMAVVDDTLQVRGVRGLRVADASIMPTLPTSNTNAAVIMIAEKAADMIIASQRGA